MKKGDYGYSENGYQDHIDCIHNAWPWQRLNKKEKNIIEGIFKTAQPTSVATYDEAWNKASSLWLLCLQLVGYQPFGWREDKAGNVVIPPVNDYVTVPKQYLKTLKDTILKFDLLDD